MRRVKDGSRHLGRAVALIALRTATAHAEAVGPDLLVVDHNAASDSTGAVIHVGADGAQSVVSTNALSLAAGGSALFSSPYDVEVAPNGDVYVIDNQGAGGTPRLVKVDRTTGRETEISTNAISNANGGQQDFQSPTHLSITSAGTIYVTDADLPIAGTSGGIIQVDPATGRQTLVASNAISAAHSGESAFHNPYASVPLPGGGFAVSNDPSGSSGSSEAGVILVDPAGKETTLSTNAISNAAGGEQPFVSPFGITRGPDGAFYVGDYGARVIKVDPTTGSAVALATGSPLATPTDVEYGGDDMLYVADPNTGSDGTGAIFRLSPTGGTPQALSTNAISGAAGGAQAFNDPIGLTVRAAPAGGGASPPSVSATAQCADKLDNDGDGAIDLKDPGCSNAADNNEGDESVSDLVLCGRRQISLVRADLKGGKVSLSGLVSQKNAGKPVQILSNYAAKAKRSRFTKLATVKAGSGGIFSARVKRPPARLVAKARFVARVGSSRSIALKLPQSLASSSVKQKGGQIELRGTVKSSLLGKRNAVVVRRLVCGHYQTVGSAKPDKKGRYVVRFLAPNVGAAALYRAESKVLAKRGSKRYVKQFARAIGIALTGQSG
jgi:sugar lactone lactonase YvrE